MTQYCPNISRWFTGKLHGSSLKDGDKSFPGRKLRATDAPNMADGARRPGGAELNRGTKPTKILGFRRSSTDADGPPRLVPAEEQSYRRRCEKSAAKSTQNSTIIAARSHRPNIAGQAAPRCPGPLTKRRRRLSFRRPISAESYYHSAAATTTIFRRRRPRRTPCRSADDRAPGSRRTKARLEKITELQNRKRTAPRG